MTYHTDQGAYPRRAAEWHRTHSHLMYCFYHHFNNLRLNNPTHHGYCVFETCDYLFVSSDILKCISLSLSIYIYIYMMYVYTYIYIYIHYVCIYIYIYTYIHIYALRLLKLLSGHPRNICRVGREHARAISF